MTNRQLSAAMRRIGRAYEAWRSPVVTEMARRDRDPFRVLAATILSLRTKDETTHAAAERLFSRARIPREILVMDRDELASIIYPVGFYRQKAGQLQALCRILVERYESRVPNTMEQLLELPGVGRKTANLVLLEGFGVPAICVDTHVHRICNRWGYVSTPTPERTEEALREKLPKRYWTVINQLLVAYGQHVCVPVSPWCSTCGISAWCDRVGVRRAR